MLLFQEEHMIKNNFTLIFFSVLLFVLSTGTALANSLDQGTMVVGYHMMDTGAGMGWMMFLFWGLVLGILILVIRWVLNLPQRENRFEKMQTSATDILKDRFAKGEIDIAEFELKQQIIAD
jgi:putative membrane protein